MRVRKPTAEAIKVRLLCDNSVITLAPPSVDSREARTSWSAAQLAAVMPCNVDWIGSSAKLGAGVDIVWLRRCEAVCSAENERHTPGGDVGNSLAGRPQYTGIVSDRVGSDVDGT